MSGYAKPYSIEEIEYFEAYFGIREPQEFCDGLFALSGRRLKANKSNLNQTAIKLGIRADRKEGYVTFRQAEKMLGLKRGKIHDNLASLKKSGIKFKIGTCHGYLSLSNFEKLKTNYANVDKMITLDEAIVQLGYSTKSTLRENAKLKNIPAILKGNKWYVSKEVVERGREFMKRTGSIRVNTWKSLFPELHDQPLPEE